MGLLSFKQQNSHLKKLIGDVTTSDNTYITVYDQRPKAHEFNLL